MNKIKVLKTIMMLCVVSLLVLSGTMIYLLLREEGFDRVPGRGWYTLKDMDEPIGSPYLRAAVMGGLYLVNCQRADGSFNYLYYPEANSYSRSDNMLRQLGTTYSVLLLYYHYPEPIFLEAGKLAMEYAEDHVEWIDGDKAHVVASGDSKLGGAALAVLCYVMYEKVADDRYRRTLDGLGNFIDYSRRESGEFRNYYMWGGKVLEEGDERYAKHTDYYPGEALLALAFLYEHTGDERYKECWDAAFDHYYDHYGGDHGYYSPFSPWAVGAAQIMYDLDKDDRYFGMSSSMAESVLYGQEQYPRSFEREEYVGGFYYGRYKRYMSSGGKENYHPRANTASKIEPPADLYRMADEHGLIDNLSVYEDRMKLAADFLANLQYNRSDAEAFPDPKRAYGGVPGGVAESSVRIDYNQHAIVAWIKVYDHLELGKDILDPVNSASNRTG